MNKDALGIFWLFMSRVVQVPLQLLVIAMITRLVGPEIIGQWAMVLAAATMLHAILFNWLQAGNTRFGREQWIERKSVQRITSARLPFILLSFAIVLSLVIFNPFQWLEYFFKLPSTWHWLVLIALAGAWFVSEARSNMQIRYALQRIAIVPIVINIALIIFLVFVGNTGDEEVISSLSLIASIIIIPAIIWFYVLWREWKKLGSQHVHYPKKNDVKSMVIYAWPLIPGFLIGYLSSWSDHFLLQYLLDDAIVVGYFHIAYSIFLPILYFSSPLYTMLFPKLIGQRLQDPDVERRLLSSVIPTTLVLWFVCIIPTIVVLPVIFSWTVGSTYDVAIQPFAILCIAIPGSLLNIFCATLFNVQGRMIRPMIIYPGIMVTINILISVLLIPNFGMTGAAIGTAISYVLFQVLIFRDQYKYLNVPVSIIFEMFGILLLFSVLQSMVSDNFLVRLLLGLVALTAVIYLSKYRKMVEPKVLNRLFPESLSGMNDLLLRLFCNKAQLVTGRVRDV